jgi:hypothetical protein
MVAALLLASGLALAEHPLSNAKVYVGSEGLRVVVATVKGDACVLQVTGLPGGLYDGLVQDCTVEHADLQMRHFVTIHGRKKLALKTDGQGAGLTENLGALSFSEAESKKENLEALWAKHQAQAAQLAAIVKFDRAAEAAESAKKVKDAAEPMNRTCGTNLALTLDWSGAPDEKFKLTRPEDSCLKIIESMTDMCRRWKIVRSTFAEKLTEVRCTYSDAHDPVMSIEGKVVTMGSNEWAVTLPGAFDQFLKEVL